MSSSKTREGIHSEYPLYKAIFYGDRVGTEKLSRRFSCATRFLPIRVAYTFEYDSLKAIEAGVLTDPTVIFDKKLIFEGLVQAESMTPAVKKYLNLDIDSFFTEKRE